MAMLLFLLLRTFVVEAFRIPSSSMERTLLPGESGALCLFDRAAGIVYTLPALTTLWHCSA